ncbi:kelch-like protein 9 [Diadema antillarum]|uniref:kelch-like protein 9 n=1 Tax=Diadema antillarum TaxID=105358 RepID=UPI003A8A9554
MPPRVAKKTPHRVERKKKETGRPATTGLIPSSKPSRLSTVAETSNVNVRGSSLTDHASRVLGAATALWRRKKLHDVILAIGHHRAAVALGGFLYVAGGRDTTCAGAPLRSACRYDPRINSWLRIADMIKARESFQLCVLRDRIYAVGGRLDDTTSLPDVERYDPCRDVWEPVASLSDPRRCVAVAAHSDRLYAVGGSGNQRISSKVEYFDPDKNEWTSRRPLSTPRFFSLLIPFGDYLYLAGGATVESGGTLRCLEHVEQYDPSTDTWRTLAAMATPRAEAAGCVVDGRMYMIGGYNWESKSWLNSAEEYDFTRDEWLAFTSFPRALTGVASCILTLYKSPP